MATASLHYDDRVGRGSLGFGLGNYAGTTALATGLNYNVTAIRVNANAAYVPNTRNVGFGLGHLHVLVIDGRARACPRSPPIAKTNFERRP